MRKLAVILEKLPPGADVLLTAQRHLAASRTVSDKIDGGLEDSDVVTTV